LSFDKSFPILEVGPNGLQKGLLKLQINKTRNGFFNNQKIKIKIFCLSDSISEKQL
jgi:hypothetical protein